MGLGVLHVVLQPGTGALRFPDGGGYRREFGSISAGTHHLDASTPILEAGDHMDVQVRDVLAGREAVVPSHVHAHRLKRALDLRLNVLHCQEEVPHRRAIEVENRGCMDSWNDEDVPAGCREDIEEGHGPWGLMNDLGRDATGEDLAEDAVGHAGSVAQVRSTVVMTESVCRRFWAVQAATLAPGITGLIGSSNIIRFGTPARPRRRTRNPTPSVETRSHYADLEWETQRPCPV